ncbi:thioredoxin family protein [Mesonia aestuariivivens]|uniref:Thioredoxin family protein n=1 Tax=Mesonia aestuariivivens TaxID=2796128 RepID=A0ABS6W1X6_9FLAO|nr:thioredoxin family protein [Mesonia aestuariivivens]MBW2961851.1 thioredoxin family protein [Mesonia aestuariivivens]
MSKFGEIIDQEFPVLLSFNAYRNTNTVDMHEVLKEVSHAVRNKGKVIKIDVEKNQRLAQALRVKVLPTLVLYKKGEMIWRKSGVENSETLTALMQQHLQEEL